MERQLLFFVFFYVFCQAVSNVLLLFVFLAHSDY